MVKRRFHYYYQDYTRRKIGGWEKVIQQRHILLQRWCWENLFLLRVTINRDGKEEKKKRREESEKDNSCVYHQREKR